MRKQWISLALIIAHGGLLTAGTSTWTDGDGNGQMNTAGNWSGGVPANNDTIIFPGGLTTAQMTVNNNIAVTGGNDGLLVGGLTITGAYQISGSPFQFPSNVTVSYGGSGSNLLMGSATPGVGGVVINSGVTLSLSSNAAGNTITSKISGAGNLAVTGGLITLSGANTYSGTTTIGVDGVSSGILSAAASGNFSPNSSVTINSGSTLQFATGGLNTIGNLIGVDAGSMVNLGTGTLTVTNSGTNTFPGTISGTNAGFALSGTGSLTLTGNNTYSTTAAPGSTTVNSGTLIAGTVNAIGSGGAHLTIASGATLDFSMLGSDTLSLGSLAGAGTLNLGGTTASFALGGDFTGNIEGTGGSLVVAAGILKLEPASGANTYTGTTTIEKGTLTINGTAALQDITGFTFTSTGGTLKTTGDLTLGSGVPIHINAISVLDIGSSTVVLNGNMTGTNDLTIDATSGSLTLGGTNSGFSGPVAIYGGTVSAGSTTAFGNGSAYFLGDDATLSLNGNNISIGSLAGAVGTTVSLGSSTLTISNGSVDDSLFGTITGTGNLALTGGTVTLMNPNTYSGTTTIQGGTTFNTYSLGDSSTLIFGTGGGTLEFGSDTTFAGGITVNGPAAVGANTYNVTLSGNFSNSGTAELFTKIGPGTLTLSGSMVSHPVSQITISGGVLNATANALGTTATTKPPIVFVTFGGTLQAAEDMTIPQSITLSINGTIDTQAHNVTVSGAIVGSYSLTKLGSGTLTLTGGNNYGGKTQIFDGTLNVSSSSFSTGSLQLVFGGTGTPIFQAANPISLGSTVSVVLMNDGTIDTNSHNMTIAGVVAGLSTFSLTKADSTGTAILTLSGANIYTGPTIVSVGTLQAGIVSTATSGAFGVGSAVTVDAAATLALNGFSNTIGSLTGPTGSFVTLGSGILTISNGNSQTFAGNISGTGGGLTLTTGTFTLSGTNSYTGATTVSAGTLTAGSTTAFASGSAFTVDSSATLNLNNYNNTIASLSGPTGGFVTLGSATLTIANGGGSTFAGVISGTGGLTLTTGTEILGGSNDYTGATTINGGTLEAAAAGSFAPGSAVSIASGGTLSLNGFNNTILSLTGPSGSAVTLGSGILTIANGNGQTFTGNIGSGSGGIALTTGAFTLAGTNSYTGPTTVNGGTLTAGSTSAFGDGSAVTVASGATLAFGTEANTVGSITNTGTVTTTTKVTLASFTQNTTGSLDLTLPVGTVPATLTTYGNIYASGAINLAGTLTLDASAYSPGSGTTIMLLQSTSGSGKVLNGSFSSTTIPAGYTLKYDYNKNQVYVITGDPSMTCQGIWVHPTSANWGDPVNWSGGTCAPGVSETAANLDTATFNDVAGSNVVVTLATSGGGGPTDQPITLFSLTLDAPATSYVIQQYNSAGVITLSNVDTDSSDPIPSISVISGTHTIDAPIVLDAANGSCQINISSSQLTLGSAAVITSASTNSLFITEGEATGILVNNGTISPDNLFILGGTINNHNAISPTEGIAIAGLEGNSSTLIVNNYETMSSGTGGNFSITGIDSPTTVNNYGTMTPASGTTFFITNATVNNNSGATLGVDDANLVFSSGTLATSGQVLANTYTQVSPAILQVNVLDASNSGSVAISGQGNLAGSLIVNALSGFSTTNPQMITLLTATGGFESAFTSSSFTNFPASVIPELITTADEIKLSTVPVAHTHFSAGPQVLFSGIAQHNTYITRKCSQIQGRSLRAHRNKHSETADESDEMYEEYIAEPEDDFEEEQIKFTTVSNRETMQKISGSNTDSELDMGFFFADAGDELIQRKQAQLAREGMEEEARRWSVYTGPIATFGHIDTVGTQVGLGYLSVGGLAGFDCILPRSEEAKAEAGLGLMVEYRKEWGTAAEDAGSLTTNRVHASAYGTVLATALPELYFEWVLGFVYAWDELSRNTGRNLEFQAKSSPTEAVFDALAGVEYMITNKDIKFFGDSFSLTPLFHVQYANDHISSYKESGAGIYDLSVARQTVQSLATSLGARFDYLFSCSKFSLLMELDAEWQREYMNNSRTVYFTAFNVTDTSTGITATGVPRNGVLLAIDLLATFDKGWQIEANGAVQWNSLLYDAFFYLGFGKTF